PKATVAIFWDDLEKRDAGNGSVYMQRMADHWLFHWHQVTCYAYPPNEDDLNFQIKLFDDGAIEFHYGEMIPGISTPWDGSSATIWLENPSGGDALVLGIDEPVVQPHTAYRF